MKFYLENSHLKLDVTTAPASSEPTQTTITAVIAATELTPDKYALVAEIIKTLFSKFAGQAVEIDSSLGTTSYAVKWFTDLLDKVHNNAMDRRTFELNLSELIDEIYEERN